MGFETPLRTAHCRAPLTTAGGRGAAHAPCRPDAVATVCLSVRLVCLVCVSVCLSVCSVLSEP